MSDLPRTYNQAHAPRRYTPGKRRVSIYIAWSYPAEANRDVTVMDNRFSTMTEVRRVAWPQYEAAPFGDPLQFSQGIAGALELFFRAWTPFQECVTELTGHAVPVFQRVDQAGYRLPLDARVLDDTDTLLVFGLDHMVTEQEASQEEIDAIKRFLKREGTCLILSPHHDVGFSENLDQRQQEYKHHGDPLVPRQQRFGTYTRSLMKGLGVPVENRFGLRPATVAGTRNQLVPLNKRMDDDKRGWLNGVNTFNFHMHLPHYAVTTDDPKLIQVLASQPIDMTHPHPFIEAGNKEFNMFLWMPPNEERAGDILLADSTIFTTLFGGDESLERFWKNLATL